VAHACNPSYSGGRNQEDLGLKPTRANSSEEPILKKNHQGVGRGGEMSQTLYAHMNKK
jgi:hypothetical protein